MTQPTPLHRLIYASQVSAQTRPKLESELPLILGASIRNNAWRGITGLLIAHKGWFLQALEGDSAAVTAIYRAILADPRHHDPVILARGPAELRSFGRWSMGARLLTGVDGAIIGALERRGSFDPSTYPEHTVMRLLHAVAQAHARSFDAQQPLARARA